MKPKFNHREALRELREFFHQETSGGIVMLLAAAAALVVANSSLASAYQSLIAQPVMAGFTLSVFVKDVLMPFFFLLVGMELKNEMMEGFLSQRGQRVLPLVAALGGIILPALIFLFITRDTPAYHDGWAIPTATDIAFAICILKLAGSRVAPAAKVFLLAIAIYDDLAAILIVAVFYSHGIALIPLAAAFAVIGMMALLNRHQVASIMLYLLLGAALWICLHAAHIHTTVAGVVTGLMIPLRAGTQKPLDAFLHQLHPYVVFGILPIFAFVSAGVALGGLSFVDLLSPLPLGIALALFFGKQLGIFGATYAAVKFGLAQKPKGTSWYTLYGISVIAGIGFTMSLFIGALAFKDHTLQDAVKLGVIAGSLMAALWGIFILKRAH